MEKKESRKNLVGENINALEGGWSFSGGVPEKFNEHVKKSVPYYEDGHNLICKISDYFVHDNSVCYELGVSTASLIRKMADKHKHKPNVRWIGVDIEQKMIDLARKDTQEYPNIELICENIATVPLEASDFISSYYTMQFIPPYVRQDVFDKVYNSLNWGGAFLLFEKVRASDARFQDMMQTLYVDYKLDQGYSTEEIVAKTKSLKGVLEPFSTQGNIDLLKRAGFVDIMTVFKYMCFEGFLAIK